MPLSALIFDVDGTLGETEEAHRAAFNEAFEKFGYPFFWDETLYADLLKVGGSRERMLHFVRTYEPATAARFEAEVDEIFAFKSGLYKAKVESGAIALRPGVARLIEEAAAAGVRLAVATTTGRSNVETLIRQCLGERVVGLFEAWATGDMAQRKKPDPELYLMALDQLGLPASACIAIEDSEVGATAAARAGIAVVMSPSRYTAEDPLDLAVAALDHLGDPGLPCRALAGERPAGDFVTLADLDAWNAAATAAAT
ncbi:MAG TPA: HAD-IA family hydrolase [Kaistiaceae bacterium]|nr:HAD-IA family hydrolase [Kaistiaceae bacterium]